MTVKELAEVMPERIDLCLHFQGNDIIYNSALADVVGDCIIEGIEFDPEEKTAYTIYANIKYIIARKEG